MRSIYYGIVLSLCLFFQNMAYSQSYHGFTDDNYNGVYGAIVNPANVADSRHRANINVISVNGLFSSDYKPSKLWDFNAFSNGFNGIDFNANFEGIQDENNKALANVDILLPSFVATINEKHAVGLILRARAFFNYNNFSGQLWEGITSGFDDTDFTIDSRNIDATTHYWREIGAAYGLVLFDEQDHFFKAGGTVKYLWGVGASQISSDILTGSYSSSSNNLNLSGDLDYLINFGSDSKKIKDLWKNSAPGIGADFGVVYEYRTRQTRRTGIGKNGRAVNKYKLKIAASVLDIGTIKYKGVSQTKYEINNANLSSTSVQNDFITALNDLNGTSEVTAVPSSGDLTVALPTSVQVNIDYNLMPKYFVNFSYNTTVIKQADRFNNNRLNLISLTPRFETKNFSAYLPISYSPIGGFAAGAGARYGPVTLGAATLFSSLLPKNRINNIYMGLNIPILEDWDHAFFPSSRKKHRKRRARKRRG